MQAKIEGGSFRQRQGNKDRRRQLQAAAGKQR